MAVQKVASRGTLKSDLSRVDSHVVTASEYRELPPLTSDMLSRVRAKKAGRPRALNRARLK